MAKTAHEIAEDLEDEFLKGVDEKIDEYKNTPEGISEMIFTVAEEDHVTWRALCRHLYDLMDKPTLDEDAISESYRHLIYAKRILKELNEIASVAAVLWTTKQKERDRKEAYAAASDEYWTEQKYATSGGRY